MNIVAVIPARYSSVRLPGKPLLDIGGKPLLYWVWKSAIESQMISRIIVATDDTRIEEKCREFGAECVLSPSELQSGSDRVMYVCRMLGLDADIITNIQCDEPMITGQLLDNLINSFIDSDADAGTLIKRIYDYEDLYNPSVVKVVLRNDYSAMYFSRNSIPYLRDVKKYEWLNNEAYWKHIGIYVYKRSALERFVELPQSNLEKSEKLEQLRLLQAGMRIHCVETELELFGVDTSEDLAKTRRIFSNINI
jgi:3-deoxy-manno-octulosonate cytidylyltransferase (CMP-KDO synthetase)